MTLINYSMLWHFWQSIIQILHMWHTRNVLYNLPSCKLFLWNSWQTLYCLNLFTSIWGLTLRHWFKTNHKIQGDDWTGYKKYNIQSYTRLSVKHVTYILLTIIKNIIHIQNISCLGIQNYAWVNLPKNFNVMNGIKIK